MQRTSVRNAFLGGAGALAALAAAVIAVAAVAPTPPVEPSPPAEATPLPHAGKRVVIERREATPPPRPPVQRGISPPATPGTLGTGPGPTPGTFGAGVEPTPMTRRAQPVRPETLGTRETRRSTPEREEPRTATPGPDTGPRPGTFGAGIGPTPGTFGAGIGPTPGTFGAGVSPTPGTFGAGIGPTPGTLGTGPDPRPGTLEPAAPLSPEELSPPPSEQEVARLTINARLRRLQRALRAATITNASRFPSTRAQLLAELIRLGGGEQDFLVPETGGRFILNERILGAYVRQISSPERFIMFYADAPIPGVGWPVIYANGNTRFLNDRQFEDQLAASTPRRLTDAEHRALTQARSAAIARGAAAAEAERNAQEPTQAGNIIRPVSAAPSVVDIPAPAPLVYTGEAR